MVSKKIAVVFLCMSAVLLAGCSSGERQEENPRAMTDDEIMQAIEDASTETRDAVLSEVEEAVVSELESQGVLTEDEIDEIKASIMASIGESDSKSVTNKYVTEQYVTEQHVTEEQRIENTYISGSDEKPRIEDGTVVPIRGGLPYVVEDDRWKVTVTNAEATVSNYTPDTPYGGGGFAYRVNVTISASYEYVGPPRDGEIPPTPIPLPQLDAIMSPYDVQITSGTIGYDKEADTMECSFSMGVNLIPDSVYFEIS